MNAIRSLAPVALVGLLALASGCASDEQGTLVLQSAAFSEIQGRASEVTARLEVGGKTCTLAVEPDTTLAGSCPDLDLGTHTYTLTYVTNTGVVLATASGTVVINAGDNGPVVIGPLHMEYDDDADGCLNIDQFTGRCVGLLPRLDVAIFPEIQNRTSEVTARLDIGGTSCSFTVETDTTLAGSCPDVATGTHQYTLTYLTTVGMILATASGNVTVNAGSNNGPLAIGALNAEYDDDTDGCLNLEEFQDKCLSFAPKADFTTGSQPQSVAIGDLDGDGPLDLVVANSASGTVSVMLGNGDGSFGPKSDVVTSLTQQRIVAVSDLNGDGALDLVVASQAMNLVSVLLGTGTGGFGPQADYSTGTGSGPRSLVVGDLNTDGNPDVAVGNLNINSVSVFLGDGTGALGPKADFGTGARPRSVAVGDLNGDAKPDLAVANVQGSSASVLIGTGTGSFEPKVDYETRERPRFVAIADLSGDGNLDLATANESTTGVVSVLLGMGTGSFGGKMDYAVGPNPMSIAVADFNGDGNPDLAVTSETSSTLSVLTGTGTGSFRAKADFATGNQPHGVVSGDFNGDGKPDLAVANFLADSVSILLNTTVF